MHKATKINTSNFNTIQKNKADGDKFIKAMLDESIKAEAGSRLRIRLLDDIEIDGNIITKGSYLYAIVNGFTAQRIQANITSVFVKNELLNVSLSIYDNDGIEGFYVPAFPKRCRFASSSAKHKYEQHNRRTEFREYGIPNLAERVSVHYTNRF